MGDSINYYSLLNDYYNLMEITDELVTLEENSNQGSLIASTSTLPLIIQDTISTAIKTEEEIKEGCNCSGKKLNKTLLFRSSIAVLLSITVPIATAAPSPIQYSRREGKERVLDSSSSQYSTPPTPPLLTKYHKRENQNSSSLSINSTIVLNNGTAYNSSTFSSTIQNSTNTEIVNPIIPDGWIPQQRPTNYYPVPVIIALSIIVSLLIAGTIIGAVLLRRGRRRRRAKKIQEDGGSAEKGLKNGKARNNEKGVKGLVSRLKGKGKSNSKSKVVKKKSGGGNGASNSGSNEDTGTSSSLARGSSNASRRRNSPLSNETINQSTTSLGLFANISRQQSNQTRSVSPSPSHHSSTPTSSANRYTTSLGRPRSIITSIRHDTDDEDGNNRVAEPSIRSPSMISLTSSLTGGDGFGFPISIPLPTPGPPAYRPNSSRIQRIIRSTESRFLSNPTSSSTTTSTSLVPPPPTEEEEEWHWPNEKPIPSSSTSRSRSTSRLNSSTSSPPPPPPPLIIDQSLLPPPIDRSTFSAHVATDDKAILNRLREIAQSTSPVLEGGEREGREIGMSSGRFNIPTAPYFDDEFEGEGSEEVERDIEGEEEVQIVSIGSLPLPPRRVITSYVPPSYTFGEEEEEFRRTRVVQVATAPPPDDDDEDGEDGEGEDVNRWEENENSRVI